MAFTDLYIQTTSNSDMNAGSTNADAASVTQTNGSWDITADTFIATAATPFSGVAVGEWASIYNDGVTSGAVYVAQVTTINNGGLSITLSTTAKYGTKPASGATGKSCKVGGAWASLAIITSLFPSVAIPASTRINIKAGTYANTTTSRTITSAGSTTAPFWWRGYNTTPGDIESNNSLTKPLITFTTGRLTITGTHEIFSNLSISGAATAGAQVAVSNSAYTAFDRVRIENTAANVNSNALLVGNTTLTATRCYFKSTSSASIVSDTNNSTRTLFDFCTFDGGLHSLAHTSVGSLYVYFCTFISPAGDAIRITGAGTIVVLNNTIYNTASDGIEMTVSPLSCYVAHNIFSVIAGYGINNSLGTNINTVQRIGNSYYSTTSGQETGLGDSPAFGSITETSDPFTNAAGGDFSLVSGALSKGAGAPGGFENQSYTSYLDNGAVQRQESSTQKGDGRGMSRHMTRMMQFILSFLRF